MPAKPDRLVAADNVVMAMHSLETGAKLRGMRHCRSCRAVTRSRRGGSRPRAGSEICADGRPRDGRHRARKPCPHTHNVEFCGTAHDDRFSSDLRPAPWCRRRLTTTSWAIVARTARRHAQHRRCPHLVNNLGQLLGARRPQDRGSLRPANRRSSASMYTQIQNNMAYARTAGARRRSPGLGIIPLRRRSSTTRNNRRRRNRG